MYKYERKSNSSGYQDLTVLARVSDVVGWTDPDNNVGFVAEIIRNEIKSIPRTNNFSADLMYSVETVPQENEIHVWKLTVKGDRKKLMCIVNRIKK